MVVKHYREPLSALLEQAVRAPRAGLNIEDGLAQRMLDDTGTKAGALPLLAFALAELCR